jgi:hypothetical protein
LGLFAVFAPLRRWIAARGVRRRAWCAEVTTHHYPWWSLAIFALCVYVVHGIVVFGEDVKESRA